MSDEQSEYCGQLVDAKSHYNATLAAVAYSHSATVLPPTVAPRPGHGDGLMWRLPHGVWLSVFEHLLGPQQSAAATLVCSVDEQEAVEAMHAAGSLGRLFGSLRPDASRCLIDAPPHLKRLFPRARVDTYASAWSCASVCRAFQALVKSTPTFVAARMARYGAVSGPIEVSVLLREISDAAHHGSMHSLRFAAHELSQIQPSDDVAVSGHPALCDVLTVEEYLAHPRVSTVADIWLRCTIAPISSRYGVCDILEAAESAGWFDAAREPIYAYIAQNPQLFVGDAFASSEGPALDEIAEAFPMADVNAMAADRPGVTALYIAVERQCPSLVSWLLQHGARPLLPLPRFRQWVAENLEDDVLEVLTDKGTRRTLAVDLTGRYSGRRGATIMDVARWSAASVVKGTALWRAAESIMDLLQEHV